MAVVACGAVYSLQGADAKDAKIDGAAGLGANASMPISKNWTLEKILSLDRDQIIALWKTLPPVTVAELHGHYMGLVPNAGDARRQASTTAFMYDENSTRGYWLGKAYKQTGPHKGEGYNRWRFPGGKVVRNGRFSTEDGTSLIDGKPSLLMNYGAYNSKSTLIDELRKLDEYVYLGLGTTVGANGKRGEPGHFVLTGPTDEWVGVEGAK
jgi:hypothetical protein